MHNYDSLLQKFQLYTSNITLIYNFITSLSIAHKSHLTILSYTQDILTAYKYFATQNPTSTIVPIPHLPLDLTQWRLFLQHRRLTITATTHKKFLLSLRAFASHFTPLQEIFDHIQLPKTSKIYPKQIDFTQLQQLLTQNLNTWQDYRNQALWILLYGSGLRISEALTLRIQQFSHTSKAQLSIIGKGNKHRTIPILDQIYIIVQNYIAQRPMCDHDLLFVNNILTPLSRFQADYLLRKLKYKLNLPDYTSCHKLRHSFVSHLVNNGACLKALQQLVGHQSLSSIESYAQVSIARLQQVHKTGFDT